MPKIFDINQNQVSDVQLNIDKKDHPFKIYIVVMTKDDAAEVCEASSDESVSCLVLTSNERERGYYACMGRKK